MNRRVFVGSVFVTLASSISLSAAETFCFQDAVGSSHPDEDSYAIWSILVPILRPGAKGYLIPTLTAIPEMNLEFLSDPPLTPLERLKLGGLIEVDVPVESQGRFSEASKVLKSERQQVVRLQRNFALSHPYRLLDAEALEEYWRLTPPGCVVDLSHPWHRDRALERKFAGFSAPCVFSRVFFDSTRCLGLVWASPSDGASTAYCFRKEGSQWRRLDWSATTMMTSC